MLIIGSLLTIGFIILRLSNLYGNPTPWEPQKNIVFTILDFIKVNKYPPSLLYAMMTLGPAIIFLALTENTSNKLASIISVYGRVPMFYYILHIYFIHLLAIICSVLFTNLSWRVWLLDKPLWINESFVGYGYSLKVVYLIWAIVVIGLYPLCKKYDAYKMANKDKWWLSYL